MLTNRFDFGDVIDVITLAQVDCDFAVGRSLLENFQSVHHFCLGWSFFAGANDETMEWDVSIYTRLCPALGKLDQVQLVR
jgi:hypothetical protein